MQPVILDMVQNDTGPARLFSLTRTDNSIVDLTGAASIDFYIYLPDSITQTNTGHTACVVQGAPTLGNVLYTWNSTDLPAPGIYNAKLVAVTSSGKETGLVTIQTSPDPALSP